MKIFLVESLFNSSLSFLFCLFPEFISANFYRTIFSSFFHGLSLIKVYLKELSFPSIRPGSSPLPEPKEEVLSSFQLLAMLQPRV